MTEVLRASQIEGAYPAIVTWIMKGKDKNVLFVLF